MSAIKLLEVKDVDPFEIYPYLTTIWSPNLYSEMKKATLTDLAEQDKANIYYILRYNEVIGITGFFKIDEGIYGLRWHGINPYWRKNGYSRDAIKLIVGEIEKQDSEAYILLEIAELKNYRVLQHFKLQGFLPDHDLLPKKVLKYIETDYNQGIGGQWTSLSLPINGWNDVTIRMKKSPSIFSWIKSLVCEYIGR